MRDGTDGMAAICTSLGIQRQVVGDILDEVERGLAASD